MKINKNWNFLKFEKIVDEKTGKPYIKRFRVFDTPWCRLYLHKIYMDDMDRDLHDHPWDFITILLSGSYVEHVPGKCKRYGPLSFIRHKAEDFHRLDGITKPVISLFLAGKKRRSWGFDVDGNWVHNNTYIPELRKGFSNAK